MKKIHVAMIGIILAAVTLGNAQTTPFNSEKGKPWYQGFDPVWKSISANSFNDSLANAFRLIATNAPTVSFRVDPQLMRREWESYTGSDNNIYWTTRTRLVFNLSSRPLWELMDIVASAIYGHWRVENDVCVLEANPEPAEEKVKPPTMPTDSKDSTRPMSLASLALSGALESAI